MSDFTSGFWEIYVAVITLVSIVACAVLLKINSTHRVAASEVGTPSHIWDEDLTENQHPLPRWWVWLFYITIAFGLVYLALYPGFGSYGGAYKWSSAGQYEAEKSTAEAEFGPLYARYAGQEIPQVAADPVARAIGQKLFLNYCAQCHASDGAGGRGFPNLTDPDWLWGGEPETIKQTIANGRNGVMPPFGPTLGDESVKDLAHYVRSLSVLTHDSIRAARGKDKFAANCVACHGSEAKGSQQLGAPNLTDKIWLYGSSEATIIETITKGRNDVMPAHKELLGEAKIQILAAYVYGLSNTVGPPSPNLAQ